MLPEKGARPQGRRGADAGHHECLLVERGRRWRERKTQGWGLGLEAALSLRLDGWGGKVPSKQQMSRQKPLEANQVNLRAAELEGLLQRGPHSASGPWRHQCCARVGGPGRGSE